MRNSHRNTVNANIEIWTKGNAGKVLDELDQGVYQNLIRNYDAITFSGYFQQLRIEGTEPEEYKSAPSHRKWSEKIR
jgi:hypothetical protein